jgi:hypothetical protein
MPGEITEPSGWTIYAAARAWFGSTPLGERFFWSGQTPIAMV